MKREYLGDSYDAVKRLWSEILRDIAPLYACVQFIPLELRDDFTQMTKIPMMEPIPDGKFSILNDPDTGIRLPVEKNQSEGRAHITVESIIQQLVELKPFCVITFDQSHYRQISHPLKNQRLMKMQEIVNAGYHCFYYVSHAPFLFAFSDNSRMLQTCDLLLQAGIPAGRLELPIFESEIK